MDGVSIFFNLTNRCNVVCKKCWRRIITEKSDDATPEIIDYAIGFANKFKKKVVLGAGENLVSKQIDYYISRSSKSGVCSTILTTNGLIIEEVVISEELSACSPGDCSPVNDDDD